MLNILFGPPGSGKTTAIQEIQQHHTLTYISVGAIYRSEVEKDTYFSKVLKHYVELNIKYPKDIIKKIVEPKFLGIKKDDIAILDGFPRHEHELDVLHELLRAQNDILPGYIIILTLSQAVAKERIFSRRVCGICDYHAGNEDLCPRCGSPMEKRHDDDTNQFDDRFSTYIANNEALVNQLAKMGFKPIYIDANGSKEKVYNGILNVLLKGQRANLPNNYYVSRTIQTDHQFRL